MSNRSSVTLIGVVVVAVLMNDYQKRAQQLANKIEKPDVVSRASNYAKRCHSIAAAGAANACTVYC